MEFARAVEIPAAQAIDSGRDVRQCNPEAQKYFVIPPPVLRERGWRLPRGPLATHSDFNPITAQTESMIADASPTDSSIPKLPRKSDMGFHDTRWSRVLRAPQGSAKDQDELARGYWPPLYYLAIRKGLSDSDAKDLVQGFFQKHFWSSVQQSRPEAGKLRTYLLQAFRCHFIDEWRKVRGQRNGGQTIHVSRDDADAQASIGPEDAMTVDETLYDRDWALTLWERAVDAVSRAYGRAGNGDLLNTLIAHGVINRDPHKLAEPDYAALTAAMAVTKTNAAQRVYQLRKKITAAFVEEVRQTLLVTASRAADDLTLKEEASYLMQVLYKT